jgi:hypothetical protein
MTSDTTKPPTQAEIGDRLAKIAVHLMDRILDGEGEDELPIEQETSAFKAITNYYAMLKKLEPPNRDERAFNGHQDAISGIGRGGSAGRNEHSASTDAASEDIDF